MATIIIDNGSGMIKAGLSNEEVPSVEFPSIVGQLKQKRAMVRSGTKSATFVGETLQQKRGLLSLSYPIEHGIITNFDNMEVIWEYTFGLIAVNPEEYPVLLSEAALNPKQNRIKMAEIMYEKFNAKSLNIEVQGLLCLYGTGRSTGLVLDCGDGVSHCVPIYSGYPIEHAIQRINLAGRDVTNELTQKLGNKGIQINTSSERDIIKTVKEKLAYVAEDYEKELAIKENLHEVQFELPDGHKITIGSERFSCAELLFNPILFNGLEMNGLHEMVYNSIQKCDIDVRRDLFENIVISGGTTMLSGFKERLELEITKKLSTATTSLVQAKVIAPENRKFSVWRGGAFLARSEHFNPDFITKDEWREHGEEILFKKRGQLQ